MLHRKRVCPLRKNDWCDGYFNKMVLEVLIDKHHLSMREAGFFPKSEFISIMLYLFTLENIVYLGIIFVCIITSSEFFFLNNKC